MRLKMRFGFSLIIILLISWADIYYAGMQGPQEMATKWHQPVHLLVLLLVVAIGYFNWKDYDAKWLKSLWLGTYGVVLAILLAGAGLYFAHLPLTRFYALLVNIREAFTSPLPFLLFFILSRYSKPKK